MTRFDLDDDVSDDPDEDDDFDEDDPDDDEEDEEEDEEPEDDDVETWQVSVRRRIPLNVGLRLTSGIKLPRLARISQLS